MDKVTTEAEWMGATDPLMLVNAVAEKASDRKLRLLLVSCCRRVWPLFADRKLREAVEAAEAFAEGKITFEWLVDRARDASRPEVSEVRFQDLSTCGSAGAALIACRKPGFLGSRYHTLVGRYMKGSYAVMRGVDVLAEAAAHWFTRDQGPSGTFDDAVASERLHQCELLRDIFGTLFRPVTINPECLEWHDRTIPKLAQAIYDERSFDRLPILADALEESGVNNPDILAHCRQKGEHVRGCWVVDLILNKP